MDRKLHVHVQGCDRDRVDMQSVQSRMTVSWGLTWLYSVHWNIINKRTLFLFSLCLTLSNTHGQKHTASRLHKCLITHSFIRSLSDKHTHTRTHIQNTHPSRAMRQSFFFLFSLPSYTRLFLWQQAPVSGTEKWKLTGSMSGLQAASKGNFGGMGWWSCERGRGVLKSCGSRGWRQVWEMPASSMYGLNSGLLFSLPFLKASNSISVVLSVYPSSWLVLLIQLNCFV